MNKQIKKTFAELDDLDKLILINLKDGLTQLEISESFKRINLKPNSLSIIEKRLKSIRERFNAKTNFHLAVIVFGN